MSKTAITTEERQVLAHELQYAFDDSVLSGAEHKAMVEDWRDQYEGDLEAKSKDWQSNVNMPLTRSHIDNVAVAISAAAVGVEPVFEVESLDPEYDNAAQEEEQFIQLWCDRLRLKTKVKMAVREALITGESWLRPGVKATGKNLPVQKLAQGIPILLNELDAVPTLDVVTFEDTMLLPFNAPCFDRAKGAFVRKFLRWTDMAKGRKSKEYIADAVDQIESYWQLTPEQTQLERQHGVSPQQVKDIWSATFECWEGIYRWVRPGDEDEQEYLITFYYPMGFNGGAGGTPTVLKCEPYKELFGPNWFFVPIIVDRVPGSMHGVSMCKPIAGLQQALNANVNQAIDAITMNIMPPLAVGSGVDITRRNLKWGPMEQWPVEGSSVQVLGGSAPQLSAVAQSMGQNEFFRQMTERTTGMSDPAMAAPTTQKKTAFEIGAVINAGDRKFEQFVCEVQIGFDDGDGLEGYAEMLVEIIKRFLPRYPISYRTRKSGGQPFKTLDPKIHDGVYQFIAHGSSNNSNPQMRMQRAQGTITAMGSCPFAQFSPMDTPEVIIKKAQGMYKAWADFYQAMGQKHPESYIGGEPTDYTSAMAVVFAVNPAVAQAIAAKAQQEQQQAQLQQLSQQTGVTPQILLQLAAAQGQGTNGPGGTGAPIGTGSGVPGVVGQPGMA